MSSFFRKKSAETPPSRPSGRFTPSAVAMNSIIVLFVFLTGLLAYAYVAREFLPSGASSADAGSAPTRQLTIVQLDVLNGCGVKGAGTQFTNFLRKRGFDVVEMKNYKTFTIPKTLVIDRVGNLDAARRVASALGVNHEHIIQQLNPDYFVDVSVVIGHDYSTLQSSQSMGE